MTYNNTQKNIFKSSLIGVIVGTVICVALMALCSLIIVKSGGISPSYIHLIVTFLTSFGAFAGGFAAGKCEGKNGILTGSICGIILFFLILIGSFIVIRGPITFSTLTKLIVIVISGGIGGIFGVNKT